MLFCGHASCLQHGQTSPLARERKRKRKREGGREKEREYLILKGITGALAPFSYLVF